MIYGIVCFATLFSFVGTVLGGIWADQSWGRFWGWDPKENGALHHRAVECAHSARALGRHDPRTRAGEPRHLRQHRDQLVLVWREHARHRPAQLRLHRGGVRLVDALCRQPGWPDHPRPAAAEILAQFPIPVEARTGTLAIGAASRDIE